MTLGDTATRVLLAVMNQRRPTVRSVAMAVGCSTTCAHRWLRQLRAEGLVTWENDTAGTLRSAVVRTPVRLGCERVPELREQPRPLDTTAPSDRRDHAQRGR